MAQNLILHTLSNNLSDDEFTFYKSEHMSNIDIFYKNQHVMNLFVDINMIENNNFDGPYLRHYDKSWSDIIQLVMYLKRRYILGENVDPLDLELGLI